ncbi:hypothetical protein D6C93_09371 [Aureobasidium pullulans]|uniref:Dystroglycan-type cadherin-like domain-containing protein n=1 Tax=Aureobasidium pullulans TaxID=5580 RepID=A0A4V4JPJ8_AURPU|nr:hypothetical protein D6D24_05600 [Aureobasidium pullulans]THY02553.1 hypothetical protein D6D03_05018 [Aureobasidium pullulans]THY81963.1 hypothetical protein D6C93_09371 [Aureobasidium pullulans]
MRGLLFSVLFNTLASALPQVAFPFNSQVPSVARANEAYAFQLAPTTFVSGDGSTLVYSLLNAPAWLSLESTTRTLYGTPGQGNTGPNVFKIVATGNDGSANMDCTLVVASNRAPTLAGNISSDLARSGPLSGPTTLLLQPSTAFAITFSDDLFGDPGTIKSYYATMADRTPLPSWLKFDSSSLTFWGMTPVLVTGSQTYGVDFIASDVAGFAGATTTFSLLISSNQLAFDTQTENITVTPEESVTLGPFRRQLQINGVQVSDSQIQRAVAKAPEWLTFQNSSLELKGTPPQDFTSQTISITVTDTYGDTAVKNIFLRSANASLFDHKIGNLTATAGKPFSYTLAPSLFSQSDLNIELDVGNASSMTAGIIVGIVIGCLAVLALFFAIAMLCCRRRRKQKQPRKKIEKGDIRPIVPYGDQEPMMVEHNHDEEKFIGSPVKHSPDEPPQLEVDLPMPMQPPVKPRHFLGGRDARQSKLSVVSSLGDGEAAIQADSNIPVWGRDSGTTHTPHHSYSAATELARQNSRASRQRLSEFGRLSPSKRASRLIKSWHPGLGITTRGTVIHRPNRKSRLSSTFSITRDRSSRGSFNTHGTSILSTKPSDYLDSNSNRNSSIMPAVLLTETENRRSLTEAEKRRSIRLVSRSESVVDRRPLAEKRQSFIRNRASSGVMSPVLFASSRRSSNMGLYSNLGSIKGSPSVRRQTTSPSLLEPPARNPRRLVSGPHIFPPGLPRAITPSPVRATNNNSPTLPPANTADNWTTTDTSSSLSRDNSDARAAAQYAEYAVEMELPRRQRTWVRPGEASPTPPPSSILRTASDSREAARRKWADRLNRNSSGNLASRSPSPLRVTLSGVSASGIKGRKQRLKSKFDEDKENRDEDQLSKLVSNDSFSGARQMRGRKSLVQVEAGNRISSSMAKVEETGDKNKANTDDTEWEDAVENFPQGHGISAGVLATSTSHAGSMRFL